MKAVFQRELGALMRSMTGWLALCVTPAAFALMTALRLRAGSAADFIRVIIDSTIILPVVAAIYASQGFAADRRSGADRLMHALPLRPRAVVLGRYLAWCVPFALGVLVSALYPVALGFFAQISALQTLGGMLFYLLSGMLVIAVALYFSRLSGSRLLNALAALAVVVLSDYFAQFATWLHSVGAAYAAALVVLALTALFFGWKATRSLPAAVCCAALAEGAGLLLMNGNADAVSSFWNHFCALFTAQARFTPLLIGVMDLGDLISYPLVITLFLALSAQGWRMEAFARRRDAR
ncbi:MAG: ABC-2 transporter permease [Eubacteriales bacterium]|nr:ABC-2 transporter permease [Eubacteriales bacterium]